MDNEQRLILLRRLLLVLIALTIGAILQFTLPAFRSGAIRTSWKWQLAMGAGLLSLAIELAVIFVSWTSLKTRLLAGLDGITANLARNRRLSVFLWSLTIPIYPLLILSPTGEFLDALLPRLVIFGAIAAFGAGLLKGVLPEQNWFRLLATCVLVYGSTYKIATFLPRISAYPLSMGWSETSRYYYASLFLSEKVYGIRTPPSVLHPSRYLLQAIPFLLPQSSLWLHRAWQVFLWIGITLASAILFARRLSISENLTRWLVILWAFLFLFQAPVLYHLLISLIIVLWGFDSSKFWQSLAVIMIASVWAGISRINWVPVPGFIGATIYFLETELGDFDFRQVNRPFQVLRQYLLKPVIWVVGGSLSGLISQSGYAVLSGNALDQFSSSFTSQLLWYRLFPSATYPLGVIPALALASAPLVLVISWRLIPHWQEIHGLRLLGIGSMLLVLLVGGLVVSAKIGGGSNLHNLDVFLILLAVTAGHLYFNRFRADRSGATVPRKVPWTTQAALVLVPLLFTLASGEPISIPDYEGAREVVQTIRQHVEPVNARGEPVLFISERHLITFRTIEGVKLVPDYEKVFMMEMAMSGNPIYLGEFHDQLRDHGFGLIVSHPLRVRYQGRSHPFGEENDAWVEAVSAPVLCYYEPILTDPEFAVQILGPRAAAAGCP